MIPLYIQYALSISKGLCLHIVVLLPNRAKSPQPAVTVDFTQAQDGDRVQLNPCKSSDALRFVLGIELDAEIPLSWDES